MKSSIGRFVLMVIFVTGMFLLARDHSSTSQGSTPQAQHATDELNRARVTSHELDEAEDLTRRAQRKLEALKSAKHREPEHHEGQ